MRFVSLTSGVFHSLYSTPEARNSASSLKLQTIFTLQPGGILHVVIYLSSCSRACTYSTAPVKHIIGTGTGLGTANNGSSTLGSYRPVLAGRNGAF